MKKRGDARRPGNASPEWQRRFQLQSGRTAYTQGRLRRAATLLHGARELAAAHGEDDDLATASFWEGAALHGLGRLREALASLERAARAGPISGDAVYRAATRVPRVLVERPALLHEIEASLGGVDRRLRQAERGDWRSRLLLVRARLALSRGRFRAALELALYALSLSPSEPYESSHSSFRWVAVLSAIWIGELTLAHAVLEEWERNDSEDGPLRTAWIPILEAQLARRAGSIPRAVERARHAWALVNLSEDRQERLAAGSAYVQAALLANDLPGASRAVRTLADYQNAEVSEHAFVYRVLRADLVLARARHEARLPALDPEFGIEADVPRTRARRSRARIALEEAEFRYRVAGAQGCELDRRLRCRLRAWQLAGRTALVERTRREMLPGAPG